MVSIENHIGTITVSEEYLSELVKHTVTGCFGVAGICGTGALKSRSSGKSGGVQIYSDKAGGLVIDLHIKVTYGTNIAAAARSITHKVGFTVEEAIGTAVHEINVFVDGMNY